MGVDQSDYHTPIRNRGQYLDYCKRHEAITFSGRPEAETEDELDLLTLLIETWDNRHGDGQPPLVGVDLLRELMNVNRLKNKDVAATLGVTPSLVSDILRGKKGFSREITRKLADTFKVSPLAFRKPEKAALETA